MVLPREACPAGLELDMDMAIGINHAGLLANYKAGWMRWKRRAGRLQVGTPLALFLKRHESQPVAVAADGGVDTEDMGVEAMATEEGD